MPGASQSWTPPSREIERVALSESGSISGRYPVATPRPIGLRRVEETRSNVEQAIQDSRSTQRTSSTPTPHRSSVLNNPTAQETLPPELLRSKLRRIPLRKTLRTVRIALAARAPPYSTLLFDWILQRWTPADSISNNGWTRTRKQLPRNPFRSSCLPRSL